MKAIKSKIFREIMAFQLTQKYIDVISKLNINKNYKNFIKE